MGIRSRHRLSCETKRRYNTINDARQVAIYQLQRQPGQAKLGMYRCKICNKYHLTSSCWGDEIIEVVAL